MKIFLLNGAKQSGKDTTAELIESMLIHNFDMPNVAQLKAAHPLFNSIPILFGIDMFAWSEMYMNEKEVPSTVLGGLSPRQTMIWLSETAVKPQFGHDHFGKALGRTMLRKAYNENCDAVIVSDCGFNIEMNAALDVYGDCRNNDVYLIRILRDGTSFDGDSREYINPEDINLPRERFYELNNHSNNLMELGDSVYSMLQHLATVRAKQ